MLSFALLDEAYVGDRGGFGDISNRAKLFFIASNVFFERPQDSLCMPRAYDHARNQFALRHIRKHVVDLNLDLLAASLRHALLRLLGLSMIAVPISTLP